MNFNIPVEFAKELQGDVFNQCISDPVEGAVRCLPTLSAVRCGYMRGILEPLRNDNKRYEDWFDKINKSKVELITFLNNSLTHLSDGERTVLLISTLTSAIASHIKGVRESHPDIRTGAYSDESFEFVNKVALGDFDEYIMSTVKEYRVKKTVSRIMDGEKIDLEDCGCPSCMQAKKELDDMRKKHEDNKKRNEKLNEANTGKEVA